MPEDLPVVVAPAGEVWLPELIVAAGFAKSNGEARRLIENGGVSYDDAKITDAKAKVEVSEAARVLKCGKRNFAEIRAGETADGKPRLLVR